MTLTKIRVSGTQVPRGGQYAGSRPQLMRVECVQDEEMVLAIEMLIPGNASQVRARDAAISCIDLLLAELRMPPRQ